MNKHDINNDYLPFLGKIKGFHQQKNTLYISYDFGVITENIPLGEFDVYTLNINEKQKEINSIETGESKGKLISINKNSTELFNIKYKNKYAVLYLPTAIYKSKRLALFDSLVKTNKLSPKTKTITSNERLFWANCTQQLDKFISRLKQNNLLVLINHNYDKQISNKYQSCFPIVYNIDIFL